MVDREARDQVAQFVEAYCSDEISAFEFDHRLSAVNTDDQTVRMAVYYLWFLYDEFGDHKIVAEKPVWDALQRMLLLLRTDAALQRVGCWRLTPQPFIAAGCLAVLVGTVLGSGACLRLLPLCMVIEAAPVLLRWWQQRSERRRRAAVPEAEPFGSVAELLACRRHVRGFSKRPYPAHLAARRIRSPRGQGDAYLLSIVAGWPIWILVFLWFQIVPYRVDYRVVPA
jgi:hypothetical protein